MKFSPVFQVLICKQSMKVLESVVRICVRSHLHQYGVEACGKVKKNVVSLTQANSRVFGSSSWKYQKSSTTAIKIPRFLKKARDREQIERYYCVKKLCLQGNSNEAFSIVEKILVSSETTTSTILILNGLLYSLFEQEKMEDIVRLTKIMDSLGIKGNRSTFTILIDSYGKVRDFCIVSKLLNDMSHLGIKPHYRSYMVATQLAVKEEKFGKAIEYFSQIDSIYKENNDGFCALFISSLVQSNEINHLENVFLEFRENKTRLGEQTILSIKSYFESGSQKEKWTLGKTIISSGGICQSCNEKLEGRKFGKPEEHLSAYFQELVNNEVNMNALGGWKNANLKELVHLLDTRPFQILIDGLNVAMHPKWGLRVDRLIKLVKTCSSEGQNVFIIAANELIQPRRSKAVSKVDHQKAITYLKSISTVYFVKHNNRGIDDLFLINAALHLCRRDKSVKIISNDKFVNHCVHMSPQTVSYFERWLSEHQVTVHWHDRNRMKLLPKANTVIENVIQKTETSWHFPSINGKSWLCVKTI